MTLTAQVKNNTQIKINNGCVKAPGIIIVLKRNFDDIVKEPKINPLRMEVNSNKIIRWILVLYKLLSSPIIFLISF